MKFIKWLKNRDENFFESIRPRLRLDLDDQAANTFAIQVGDIIELGPETQLGGRSARGDGVGSRGGIARFAKVSDVRGNAVVADDLSKNDGTKILIPLDQLYNKEELRGRILNPADERSLKALGGKTLWIKLTPRQHRKFKSKYKAEPIPDIMPTVQNDAPAPSVLRRMFAGNLDNNQEKPSPEILKMFDKDLEERPSRPSFISRPAPLARFQKRRDLQ
jgi:hypothetical protein